MSSESKNEPNESTSTEPTQPATGEHTTNGVPHGATSLTPFLAIPRAAEAIDAGHARRTLERLVAASRAGQEGGA